MKPIYIKGATKDKRKLWLKQIKRALKGKVLCPRRQEPPYDNATWRKDIYPVCKECIVSTFQCDIGSRQVYEEAGRPMEFSHFLTVLRGVRTRDLSCKDLAILINAGQYKELLKFIKRIRNSW